MVVGRTGANGVAMCFSAASMSTARQRHAVVRASMNTPCAGLIPGASTGLAKNMSHCVRSARNGGDQLCGEVAWSQRDDKARCCDATEELCDAKKHETHGANDAAEKQGGGHVRVEEATGDAEEEPRRDEQAEAKAEGYVEDAFDTSAAGACRRLLGDRRLHATKGEHQESGCAYKLDKGRLEVIAERREGAEVRWRCHG